jgi:hypothetical protein
VNKLRVSPTRPRDLIPDGVNEVSASPIGYS